MIQNSKILVTGGAGFIGSNLCEALLNLNNQVVCLDNYATGKLENIRDFLDNPNFSLINGDIRDLAVCKNATSEVDYVLHQAALGSVPRSLADPITTNAVNISGFLNMLVASKEAQVKRFVYACSSSTYGDTTAMPKTEDVIGKPLSPYAVTKYVNELYADVFHKAYGLDTIGLRYFNVFGPKQDPNGLYAAVIPKFASQLINHESPVINGDGEFSRDFTYIANVVHANILALTTGKKEALNTIYNIAYGGRITLNTLVQQIKSCLAVYDPQINAVAIQYALPRAGDIPHSFASVEKAKNLLAYAPQYDVEKGLQKTMEWYWNAHVEAVQPEQNFTN